MLYGVEKTFLNSDIVSTRQTHNVDPLSRRLPQETMQFVILDYEHNYEPDNPSGIYQYVDKNSPVSIQFGYELPNGKVEWLKPDKYVLNSKPKASRNQATFSGTGLIGSLSGTFYKSKLGSKNFYDMAEEVLLDAGLTLSEQGTNPWVIDESLTQMFTTAALPIDTHMNCLQLIAHACRCRLFTDDDNIIHIITAVGNIGRKDGYDTRTWKKHGHLPYVTYDTAVTAPVQPEIVKPEAVTSVKATGVAKSFNKSVAGKYTVTATSLNVRDAAGVENEVLVAIPKGTVVQNYGYYTVVDGVKWLYVQFTYKRVTYIGFCSSTYLKK